MPRLLLLFAVTVYTTVAGYVEEVDENLEAVLAATPVVVDGSFHSFHSFQAQLLLLHSLS
jgi:hypothetical protein